MHRTPLLALVATLALPASGIRAATFTVTTTADAGAGSLRQALTSAAAAPGADTILFTPVLNGQAITLTGGALATADAAGVTIDATALPSGLVIRGNGADRVFLNTGLLTLRGLTLTGGYTGPCCGGAAVYSSNVVTLEDCTLTGNSAGLGGALFNDGTATLLRSSVWGNTALTGSAIYNRGASLDIRHSTVAGNAATANYSIYNDGTLLLLHATVAANAAAGEGGIYNAATRTLTLQHSVIGGGNTGATDLTNAGTVTLAGANYARLAIVNAGGTVGGGGALFVGDPKLQPLGQLDGRTRALYPQPGSPLIDGAAGSVEATDQLGLARPVDGDANGTATADLGAVEYDPLLVTSAADIGPGTLRSAIVTAAAIPGPDTIRFARPLEGVSALPGNPYNIYNGAGLTIDGTGLLGGFTIDGRNLSPLFAVNTGAALTLRGLTLVNGWWSAGAPTYGGAVTVLQGTLTIDRCELGNNRGVQGGAIYADSSPMTIKNSTFYYNQSVSTPGGAIEYHDTAGTLAALTVSHSTFTWNGSNSSTGAVGGIRNTARMFIGDSIIHGSQSQWSAPYDIVNGGHLTVTAPNIIGAIYNNGVVDGPGPVSTADPLLTYPMVNGGPTPSELPPPGSPAIDAATGSTEPIDQRGAARPFDGDGNGSAIADLGAVEAGGCAAPSWPIQVSQPLRLSKGTAPGSVRFSFNDPNTVAARTGERIRRTGAPANPPLLWPILGENVQDEDAGTPDIQWTDPSGTVPPAGIWFYQVVSENAPCGFEGPY